MPTMTLDKARVVDPVLTTVVQGYRQPEFIGTKFCIPVPVGVRAGRVVEFGKEDFALYDTRRAPGGPIQRTQSQYGSRQYNLYQDAIAEVVPLELFEEALNGAARVNLRNSGPKKAMRKISLRLEKDIADLIQNSALYETSCTVALSGNDRWDIYDNAASDPGADIRDWKEAIRAQIGVYPNRMGLGPLVFNKLSEHPNIKDRLKYTSMDSLTTDMLAAWFGFSEGVHVGSSLVLNPAGTFADIWGKNVWLAYVPNGVDSDMPVPNEAAQKETPAFGYTYTLRNYPVAMPERLDEDIMSYIYAVMAERSPQLVGMGNTGKVGAGFLARTVIS